LRLLAFHFEETAFDRWYVFLVLFVVTLVAPVATRLISDGVSWVVAGGSLTNYLNGEAATRLSADAAALPGYAWAVAILLTPWLFNRWRRSVGPTVHRLTQSGRLLGPTAPRDPKSEETYSQLQTDLRRAVLSPWRYLFVAAGLVLFLVPAVRLELTIGLFSHTRQLGAVGVVYDLRALLLVWVWAPVLLYFLGIGAWSMYVTSRYLKRLVEDAKALYAYDRASLKTPQEFTSYLLTASEGLRDNKRRFAEAGASLNVSRDSSHSSDKAAAMFALQMEQATRENS